MRTETYDDSSTLTFDGNGVVIAGTDSTGAPIVPAGSILVAQAQALFDYGVRAAIDSRFRSRSPAATTAAPSTPAAAQLGRLVPILLLAGLGFLAYRALR